MQTYIVVVLWQRYRKVCVVLGWVWGVGRGVGCMDGSLPEIIYLTPSIYNRFTPTTINTAETREWDSLPPPPPH